MMERPILFSAPMVQVILAGRKTMTRRVINKLKGYPGITEFGQSDTNGYDWHFRDKQKRWHYIRHDRLLELCPYGKVGDQLWVRETFTQGYEMTLLEGEGDDMNAVSIIYKADGKELYQECPKEVAENWGDWSCDGEGDPVFKPSIHMPRWASRILLEITDIRIERLQDISEADALAEGVEPVEIICSRDGEKTAYRDYEFSGIYPNSPKDSFKSLWRKINGADSWAANPWVWVVSFRVVRGGDL